MSTKFPSVTEIFGFAGIIVYSIDEFTVNGNLIRLSWAHALCGLGLFLSLIGSIMMACSQQSLPAAKAAAGRIIAKAPGYENLGHNRSASLQSRTTIKTQMSPYQGRSAPVISGPYPSAAAAAAASATVSPKQPRAAATVTATGGSQSEAVHGGRTSTSMHSLDAPASPSRRRTSGAGQERQFAGVHNQGKHPPLFANQHFQSERRLHNSTSLEGAWSEERRVLDPEGAERALRIRAEQQYRLEQMALARAEQQSWNASDERERSWVQHSHSSLLTQQHQERQFHSHVQLQACHPAYPPPPPPSAAVPPYAQHPNPVNHHLAAAVPPYPHNPNSVSHHHQGAAVSPYVQHPNQPVQQHYVEYQSYPTMQGRQSLPQNVAYSYTGYPSCQASQGTQTRPDSGSFPDPPTPEQLLSLTGMYPEDRGVEGPGYSVPYPGVVQGMELQQGQQVEALQPMVVYRAPSQPGMSPVTETVVIKPQDPYPAANNPRPVTPHSSPLAPTSHQRQHYHQQQLQHHHQQQLLHHHQQQQQHQTFPRQSQAQLLHEQPYSTFGR